MAGLGSFALAGAVGGVGDNIIKEAQAKRETKLAELKRQHDREDMATKHDYRMEEIAASKRGRGGRGGGGGGGGGPRGLGNTDTDNLARVYKSYIDSDAFEGEAPSLGEFQTRVEEVIGEEGSLSRAAERARGEWGSEEVTTTELKERHPLSPARIFDDDGKYEETTTDLQYGFKGRGADVGDTTSQGGAPDPESTAVIEQARQAIASGADRNAVLSRLEEMGIDPRGL